MSIASYHVISAVRSAEPAHNAPAHKEPGIVARALRYLIAHREAQAYAELRRRSILLPHELEEAGWKINERSEDSLPFMR